MDTDKSSQHIEIYDAKVHMNNKVYYVTIPRDIIRRMSIKKDDLVVMKIAFASPPNGF